MPEPVLLPVERLLDHLDEEASRVPAGPWWCEPSDAGWQVGHGLAGDERTIADGLDQADARGLLTAIANLGFALGIARRLSTALADALARLDDSDRAEVLSRLHDDTTDYADALRPLMELVDRYGVWLDDLDAVPTTDEPRHDR